MVHRLGLTTSVLDVMLEERLLTPEDCFREAMRIFLGVSCAHRLQHIRFVGFLILVEQKYRIAAHVRKVFMIAPNANRVEKSMMCVGGAALD